MLNQGIFLFCIEILAFLLYLYSCCMKWEGKSSEKLLRTYDSIFTLYQVKYTHLYLLGINMRAALFFCLFVIICIIGISEANYKKLPFNGSIFGKRSNIGKKTPFTVTVEPSFHLHLLIHALAWAGNRTRTLLLEQRFPNILFS